MNLSFKTLFVLGALAASATVVSAEQNSAFTSCLTPTGIVTANYSDGNHGIVGMGNKIGKDTVYSLPNGDSMQCFCGSDGSGIQTNWMKISDLSNDQVKVYENQGWIYVPTGASWGLEDTPYLAQNLNYSCSSSSTTNSGGGDGKTDGKTDGKSDNASSYVQSARGTDLASTGNMLFIAEIFAAGVILTAAGIALRLKSK